MRSRLGYSQMQIQMKVILRHRRCAKKVVLENLRALYRALNFSHQYHGQSRREMTEWSLLLSILARA
jgi:hypothetical protein